MVDEMIKRIYILFVRRIIAMPEFEWKESKKKKKKMDVPVLRRTKYEKDNKELFDNLSVENTCELARDKTKITLQEINFCHEYLTDLDVGNAAVRASLINGGGSATERYDKAMIIFNQPRVQRYLAKIFEDRIEATKVTGNKVIHELAKIAFNDPVEYFDEFGDVKSIKDIHANARAAIKEIETRRVVEGKGEDRQVSQVTKIKLYDKQVALTTLMKHTGQLPTDSNNTYNINYHNNSKTTNVALNNTIRLDEFSDQELQVMQKMVGDEKLEDIVELERIEQGALDYEDYME
jgi:phage terminase small subunit